MNELLNARIDDILEIVLLGFVVAILCILRQTQYTAQEINRNTRQLMQVVNKARLHKALESNNYAEIADIIVSPKEEEIGND